MLITALLLKPMTVGSSASTNTFYLPKINWSEGSYTCAFSVRHCWRELIPVKVTTWSLSISKYHHFCLTRSALSVPYCVRNNGLKLRLHRNLSLKIISLYALGFFGLVRDSFLLTLLLSFFSFTSTHRYAAFPLPCLSFTFTHIHTQRLSSPHSSFHMTLLGLCTLYLWEQVFMVEICLS